MHRDSTINRDFYPVWSLGQTAGVGRVLRVAPSVDEMSLWRLQFLFAFLGLSTAGGEVRLALGSEAMEANDIRLLSGEWTLESVGNDSWEALLSLGTTRFNLDYRPNAPIDPFGADIKLEQTLVEGTASFRHIREAAEYSFSFSIYDGFRNPASIWIDEYYAQQYGTGGLPGVRYEEPNPKGWNAQVQMRREIFADSGFLTLSTAFLSDRVAPGYEIEDVGTSFELVRGETRLDSWTAAASWEGLVNEKTRTVTTIRFTDTDTRDLRVGLQASLHYAISMKWIFRGHISAAREGDSFSAWSLSPTLEYRPNPAWGFALTGRYYEDTGQIETANLVSSAAPGLLSWQTFVQVRYYGANPDFYFTFSAGPYYTDFNEVGIGTERFLNLYRDRDWMWARLAFRTSF